MSFPLTPGDKAPDLITSELVSHAGSRNSSNKKQREGREKIRNGGRRKERKPKRKTRRITEGQKGGEEARMET